MDIKKCKITSGIPDDQFKVSAFSAIFAALQRYSYSSNTVVFGSLARKFKSFQENPDELNTNPYTAGDVDVCVILANDLNHLQDVDTRRLVISPLINIARTYYGVFDPFFLVKTVTSKLDSLGHLKTVDDLLVRNDYSTGVVYAKKKREILKSIRSDGVPLQEFLDTYWDIVKQQEIGKPHEIKKQKLT